MDVALSSGVSAAILTSVTAPSKVVLISPSSTAPTFTKLAKEGKTGGYWFRTTPSDALQGVAMAKVALDSGFKKVAVLYLNNAYGQGLSSLFANAFTKLGGRSEERREGKRMSVRVEHGGSCNLKNKK